MRPDQITHLTSTESDFLLPCPFCGHTPEDLRDALHPTGTQWFEEEGRRHYRGRKMPKPVCFEVCGDVWEMGCLEHEGGCGATVCGDSRAQVIEKWNRRTAR